MINNLLLISLTGLLLVLPFQSNGQSKKVAVNFLAIQGPIFSQKRAYHLTWSAHPDASLYKHEYLAAGDNFPNYKSLIMVDFVITDLTVDQAIVTKVRQLEELKKANPGVNYEVIGNKATGEVIIDCLISQTAADDRNSVVERNVLRYKPVNVKSGQRGILLFGVSERKYGSERNPFLTQLKVNRPILIREVAKHSLPEISIAR